LSPFLLNLYSKYLAKEGPEGFRDLTNRRTSNSDCEICTRPCATSKGREKAAGHDYKLTEIGRCYGIIECGENN
jgi:hypothetical protein